ncbi:MAG TPA: alpha/beta fold hydrolase [Steroidobacteraceae bacterium]
MSGLHVRITGRGRDLVLLHGWAANLGVWKDLTRALSHTFRIISLDLPGHGKSDWDPRAHTPAAQTWRVHETLAPLTERYSLLGWSLGGQFALDLAAAMPGAIENLVLVNSSPRFLAAPGWPYGSAAAMLRRLEARLAHDRGRAIDDFMNLQVRGTPPRTAARVLKKLRTVQRIHGAGHYEALVNGLERLKNGDLRAALTQVRVPTLVIGGSHDRIIHPSASRALAALAGGRYVEIREAGHAPFLSHPTRFAQLVKEFVRD